MSPLREGYLGSKAEPDGSKVETDVVHEAHGRGEKSFSAIVKVSEPDYVPQYVRLRSRLSPQMFTAQVTQPDLKLLEKDPAVVSISLSRLLTVG